MSEVSHSDSGEISNTDKVDIQRGIGMGLGKFVIKSVPWSIN